MPISDYSNQITFISISLLLPFMQTVYKIATGKSYNNIKLAERSSFDDKMGQLLLSKSIVVRICSPTNEDKKGTHYTAAPYST